MAKNQYEELTDQQRKFAELYFSLNNGTKAAIEAGYAPAAAHVQASRLLKNDKVRDYIEEMHKEQRERVHARLRNMAVEAAEKMFELALTAESENVRATALKDVLDRAGYKPTDKVEQKSDLNGKIEFGFVDPNAQDNSQ